MGRVLAFALLATALSCAPLAAEQPLVEPSYGSSFEGAALGLECVATLKALREPGLVESFKTKDASQRRICLEQLLRSLMPEPDFTAADFQRSLVKASSGDGYDLRPDPAISRTIGNRLGVNTAAARGLAALAAERLIDDPFVFRPLVECLSHPLLEVGRYCNRALVALTRHTYGAAFFRRAMNAPALTVENRDRLIADWTTLIAPLPRAHLIFDRAIEAECQAALRAVGRRLIPVLPHPSTAVGYLGNLVDLTLTRGYEETIFTFDVGGHNAANWRRDEPIRRIALTLRRPGVPRPASITVAMLPVPDYHETFPALDLELRFEIATADDDIRRAAIRAVTDTMTGLRAANTNAAR